MPPALSTNSWIATLREYHDADDKTVSMLSRMLTDIIGVSGPENDRVASILDFYALQLISSGGWE